jgi:hypothetical protein
MAPIGAVRANLSRVPSFIPDSGGIHQWPVQEGETTTIEDIQGSRDLSLNVDFTAAEANAVDGRILDPDATNDFAENQNATAPAGDMTIAITCEFSNLDGNNRTVGEYGDSQNGTAGTRVIRSVSADSVRFQAFNDSGNASGAAYSPTQNELIRLAAVLDVANGEIRIAENGSVQATSSISGSFSTQETYLRFNDRTAGGAVWGGRFDNPTVDDTAWDSSKLSEDYNDQPFA